jgi:hypothetical protein
LGVDGDDSCSSGDGGGNLLLDSIILAQRVSARGAGDNGPFIILFAVPI